jgi:hypothetical protein
VHAFWRSGVSGFCARKRRQSKVSLRLPFAMRHLLDGWRNFAAMRPTDV